MFARQVVLISQRQSPDQKDIKLRLLNVVKFLLIRLFPQISVRHLGLFALTLPKREPLPAARIKTFIFFHRRKF